MQQTDGDILVTGASGFVGRALTDYLSSKQRPVVAGVRNPRETDRSGKRELVLGALDQFPSLEANLGRFATIVHCAGVAHRIDAEAQNSTKLFQLVNCDATLHFANQARRAGVRRFVFLSTIGVNGERTYGRAFRATDTPRPQSHYAVSKLDAEIGLRRIAEETGLEVVIVRPPLIIGPYAIGNVGVIAKCVKQGIPLPFALATSNKRTVASIETVISLIEKCIDHPAAANQTFLAGDSNARSTREIIEMVGNYHGRKPLFLPVPVLLLRAALSMLGKAKLSHQLFGDLEVDISEAVNALDWRPAA